jgi:hypothetical protein
MTPLAAPVGSEGVPSELVIIVVGRRLIDRQRLTPADRRHSLLPRRCPKNFPLVPLGIE